GLLALFMAMPPREVERRGEINALLDTAFAALHDMGNEAYAALIKDQMRGTDFVRFLHLIARRRPRVYRDVLKFAGLGPLAAARWLEGLSRAVLQLPASS
ncbi:MAG TPA: lycopene cyclase, partial [Archangium sp.]